MRHHGDPAKTVPGKVAVAFFGSMVGDDVACIQDEAVVHAWRIAVAWQRDGVGSSARGLGLRYGREREKQFTTVWVKDIYCLESSESLE